MLLKNSRVFKGSILDLRERERELTVKAKPFKLLFIKFLLLFVIFSFNVSLMLTFLFMATPTSLRHMNMREGFTSTLVQLQELIIHCKGKTPSRWLESRGMGWGFDCFCWPLGGAIGPISFSQERGYLTLSAPNMHWDQLNKVKGSSIFETKNAFRLEMCKER